VLRPYRRRLAMKYLVCWTQRRSGSSGEEEISEDRALKVFSKWAPHADLTIQAFLSRIDGRGGYVLLETDSADALLDGPAVFGPWLDYDIIPVVDIQDAVVATEKGREFRLSVK